MNLGMKQALKDLEFKKKNLSLADIEYEDVAYLEMKAAESRVLAIIREAKNNEGGNFQR